MFLLLNETTFTSMVWVFFFDTIWFNFDLLKDVKQNGTWRKTRGTIILYSISLLDSNIKFNFLLHGTLLVYWDVTLKLLWCTVLAKHDEGSFLHGPFLWWKPILITLKSSKFTGTCSIKQASSVQCINYVIYILYINFFDFYSYNDGDTERFLGDFNKNNPTKVSYNNIRIQYFCIQHFPRMLHNTKCLFRVSFPLRMYDIKKVERFITIQNSMSLLMSYYHDIKFCSFFFWSTVFFFSW